MLKRKRNNNCNTKALPIDLTIANKVEASSPYSNSLENGSTRSDLRVQSQDNFLKNINNNNNSNNIDLTSNANFPLGKPNKKIKPNTDDYESVVQPSALPNILFDPISKCLTELANQLPFIKTAMVVKDEEIKKLQQDLMDKQESLTKEIEEKNNIEGLLKQKKQEILSLKNELSSKDETINFTTDLYQAGIQLQKEDNENAIGEYNEKLQSLQQEIISKDVAVKTSIDKLKASEQKNLELEKQHQDDQQLLQNMALSQGELQEKIGQYQNQLQILTKVIHQLLPYMPFNAYNLPQTERASVQQYAPARLFAANAHNYSYSSTLETAQGNQEQSSPNSSSITSYASFFPILQDTYLERTIPTSNTYPTLPAPSDATRSSDSVSNNK
ncbi:MAG: hypothetical protein K2Q14_05035 [Gammaproteobacteria bacterium]|nr:hypothetical protein [Gammaproteobacteria bacterium]